MVNKPNYWLDILGADVRRRLDPNNQIVLYQPQPRSIINEKGFSIVNPDYFKEAIIFPILDTNLTEITVPLDRIIAISAIENLNPESYNAETIYWDTDDQVIVNKIRDSIQDKTFDFTDTRGIFVSELPGSYYILGGGRHRIIAMILEGITQLSLQIKKIKNPDEFQFVNPNNEYAIQRAIDDHLIIGKIVDDKEVRRKLILNKPNIETPLQLFNSTVSDELIDVLAQTLPFN